jgi:hypothetical protein
MGHRAQVVLGIGVLGIGHRVLGIGHRVLGMWACWASGIAPPVMHRRTRESQLPTDRAAQMRVKSLVLAGVVVTLLHRE